MGRAAKAGKEAAMDYTPSMFLSVPEAALELHTKAATLREWASREQDPFPIRIMPWCERNGIVPVGEMMEWCGRNSRPYRS